MGINLTGRIVNIHTDKINKFLPGSKIFVKKYKKLNKKDVDFVFLGAWNFKKEIFKKESLFIKQGGKFITHIPNVKIISDKDMRGRI